MSRIATNGCRQKKTTVNRRVKYSRTILGTYRKLNVTVRFKPILRFRVVIFLYERGGPVRMEFASGITIAQPIRIYTSCPTGGDRCWSSSLSSSNDIAVRDARDVNRYGFRYGAATREFRPPEIYDRDVLQHTPRKRTAAIHSARTSRASVSRVVREIRLRAVQWKRVRAIIVTTGPHK